MPLPNNKCKPNTGNACPAWWDGTYCNVDIITGEYYGVLYYCDVSTAPSQCVAMQNFSCSGYTWDNNNDDNKCGFQLDCDGNPILEENVQVKCTQHFALCR